MIDGKLGSGVSMAAGDDKSLTARTPLFVDLDVGFVFDGDFETEVGVGLTIFTENEPRADVGPQIRLVRDLGGLRMYVGAGLPVRAAPIFTLFGAELSGGLMWALHPRFSLLADVAAIVYFAGSDLPEDGPVVAFNPALGGRLRF